MVVCDDGSSDATIAILEAFAQTSTFPVRIVRNAETLRPAQNFAQCIRQCSGDIIVLTDQDDLWFADRIANTARAFQASPHLTFVFSECPLIDAEGRQLDRGIYSSLPVSASDRRVLMEGKALLPVLLRNGVLYGTTMALRADLRPLFLPVPYLWSHDEWIGLVLSAIGPFRPPPIARDTVSPARRTAGGNRQLDTADPPWNSRGKHSGRHYDSELLRYQQAIDAARHQPAVRQSLLPLLEAKMRFLVSRRRVQTGGVGELPLFSRMLFSGAYARFSSGVRSPLKDLLMNFGIFGGKT